MSYYAGVWPKSEQTTQEEYCFLQFPFFALSEGCKENNFIGFEKFINTDYEVWEWSLLLL